MSACVLSKRAVAVLGQVPEDLITRLETRDDSAYRLDLSCLKVREADCFPASEYA
jgi:hypothetical protein